MKNRFTILILCLIGFLFIFSSARAVDFYGQAQWVRRNITISPEQNTWLVAIGTTTPSTSKLSVWSNGTTTEMAFEVTNSASTTLFSILDNGTIYAPGLSYANFGKDFWTYFNGTTTDALTVGSSNLYWTNALFDARLSASTTFEFLTSAPNLTTIGTIGNLNATNATIGTLTISSLADGGIIAGTSTSPSYRYQYDTNTGLGWISDDKQALYTNGTERLTIDSSGNVGIGTTGPLSVLNVAGTTGITWAANGNSLGLVTLGTQGTSGGSLFINTGSVNPEYGSGLAVDGTHGTPSQMSVVNIKALGPKFAGYGSILAFSTTNGTSLSEWMRIDNQGNVGIGTTSPGTLLAVQGDSFVNDNLTVGGILTATSSLIVQGTATSTFSGGLSILTNGGFQYTDLANCDTIDTDANGSFRCGVDASGASSPNVILKELGGTTYLAASTTANAWYFDTGFVSNASSTINSTLTITGTLDLDTALADGEFIKTGDWTGTFDGQQGIYYLDADNLTNFGKQFYTFFNATNTDALNEGSANFWATQSRWDTYWNASTTLNSVTLIPNLSITGSQVSDFDKTFYTYFNGTTTDALAQGTSNKYYSTLLFATDLAGTTTDALSVGSTNLYWTNSLFDARLSASSSPEYLIGAPSLISIGNSSATTTFLGDIMAGNLSVPGWLEMSSFVATSTTATSTIAAGLLSNEIDIGGNFYVNSSGEITKGSWKGTDIDISDNTNFVAGDYLTLVDDTAHVDKKLATLCPAINIASTTGTMATTTSVKGGYWPVPNNITIQYIECSSTFGTSTIASDAVATSTPNSAGTEVLYGLQCGSEFTNSTSTIGDNTISIGNALKFWIPDSEPTGDAAQEIRISICYTKDD